MRSRDQGNQPRSLGDVVYAIDNERDLSNYITSYASKVPSRGPEIKYERNAVSPLHDPMLKCHAH